MAILDQGIAEADGKLLNALWLLASEFGWSSPRALARALALKDRHMERGHYFWTWEEYLCEVVDKDPRVLSVLKEISAKTWRSEMLVPFVFGRLPAQDRLSFAVDSFQRYGREGMLRQAFTDFFVAKIGPDCIPALQKMQETLAANDPRAPMIKQWMEDLAKQKAK